MNKIKQFIKKTATCILLAFAVGGWAYAEGNPKPFVIPELKTWEGAEGRFTPNGRIVTEGNSKELQQVAQALSADYLTMFGRDLKVVKGKAKVGDIVLSLQKDESLGTEGYKMNIGDQLHITAATTQGVYWGTRTLLQMTELQGASIAKGATTDIPEYALRGFMIDVGRKFAPMSYLENLVKVMAYYKMNTLQVHLNDNGFRQFFNNSCLLYEPSFAVRPG